MEFYSHSKKDVDGCIKGSKLLKIHIEGVLNKALLRLNKKVDFQFTNNNYDLDELLTLIVKLHDLGKYTSYFQNYLMDHNPIDQTLKQHAKIGGIIAYNVLKNKNEKAALLALYLIFLHHSKLIDISDIPGKLDEHLKRIIEFQIEDLGSKIAQIEIDSDLKGLTELFKFPDEKIIRKAFINWSKRDQNISNYFEINYLFSLLIEADKLDASDTPLYELKAINSSVVDERFNSSSKTVETKPLKALSNNELRNYCRCQVAKNLTKEAILEQYIFTLTAPTGIGKTMIALDFSLKLKAKMKECFGKEATIIYALPFINIIEQSLKEYKKTLPEQTEILAHYQYSDVFGKEDEKGLEGEEKNYNQRLMALDTWQGDIIITSFVQFFETLIGNRNKLLKKFNHLACSIIILDEVQTLRLDQMPLIGATLFYLAKFLKARIILMTATKPKVFELAQNQILSSEGETIRPLELLDCYEEVFSCFERTKIIPLINHEFSKENISKDFTENIFAKYWKSDMACIIVCNTVKRSIEIFDAIQIFLERHDLKNPVEYLSTNIVPAHRFERIQRIKDCLAENLAPILISTQVVEAGVDLDFDMGFRDIGPIDSLIQVAGRVNRNNNPIKTDAPLYIIDFGDAQKIYGKITYEQSKRVLGEGTEFFERDYLKLINEYFDNISEKKSFSYFNKIFDSMKMLRYDSDAKEDRPVSSFRIIEESNTTQSVFIEMGDEEAGLKEKYLNKISCKLSKEEFDRKYKQDFQQRIISVPSSLTKELSYINDYDQNIKIVPFSILNQYYREKTGFIRSKEETVTFF